MEAVINKAILLSENHTLFMVMGNTFILRSNDVNVGHFYVDEFDRKITEPIHYYKFYSVKNKKPILVHHEPMRESKATEANLSDKLIQKLTEYKLNRRNTIIAEFGYRRKIQSIKPINFKFTSDIVITMETKFHSSVELKTLVFYINGYPFSHNNKIVSVDFEPTTDYVFNIAHNITYVYSHYLPIKYLDNETIEINLGVIPKKLMYGSTFKIDGVDTTIMTIYGDSNKDEGFYNVMQNNKFVDIHINNQQLITENLVDLKLSEMPIGAVYRIASVLSN